MLGTGSATWVGAGPGRVGGERMATPITKRIWRVLVVDDEENLNWSLVNSLRKDSYAVDGALNGEQALSLLNGQPYDIVISDVKMPGMDGFELLQWLRQNRPQTRVVMMTAFGSPTDRSTAVRGGVIAYLEKPFDLLALKEELRRITSSSTDQHTSGPTDGDGYDLLEVTRVISLARRDISLLVESNRRVGRLRFLRGELVWAEAGEVKGDDAFVLLTSPRYGRAQPEQWDGRTNRNITQPLAQLIFTAMIQRDRPAQASQSTTSGQPSRPLAQGQHPNNGWAPQAPTVVPSTPDQVPAFAASSVFPARGSDVLTSPTTAALPPLAPIQVSRVRAILESMAESLPPLGGLALLRPDGTVVAQRWTGAADASAGLLAHLAASGQAATRALLLSGWGDLEDVAITSQDRLLLLRRLGRSDRAALVLLVLPREADILAARRTLMAREADLVEALR